MPIWRVMSKVDRTVPGAQAPVDLLLPEQANAKAQAVIEKNKPGVTAVSVHLCPHAQGETSGWYNCRDDVRAQYEEV